jgi:hypothetical protein
MKSLVAIGVAVLMLAPVPIAHAQEGPGFSFDATVGGGHAFGGGTLNVRGFGSADGLLAIGRRRPKVSSVLVGLDVNVQQRFGSRGDECVIVVGVPTCLPNFPNLTSVSLLGGVSHAAPLASSVAVMGGAGAYFVEGGSSAFGFQGRVDVGSGVRAHTALVVSLRGMLLPNLQGNAFTTVEAGLGFRIQ